LTNAAARSGSFAYTDNQVAAPSEDGVGLAIDVRVIEPDDAELDPRLRAARPLLSCHC